MLKWLMARRQHNFSKMTQRRGTMRTFRGALSMATNKATGRTRVQPPALLDPTASTPDLDSDQSDLSRSNESAHSQIEPLKRPWKSCEVF